MSVVLVATPAAAAVAAIPGGPAVRDAYAPLQAIDSHLTSTSGNSDCSAVVATALGDV